MKKTDSTVTFPLWAPLLLMAFGCLLCGFLPDISEATACRLAPLVLLPILLAATLLVLTKKMTTRRAVLLLFITGFVLRILYVLYTPYNVRQHDVWYVTSGKGHMAYIQHFADTLALPQTNRIWQFTHPPLHHFVAGQLYRVLQWVGLEPTLIAEKLQFLTAFYSCALMAVCDRLFVCCGLNRGGRVLANAVIAFHPTFLLLAGSLNNDTLCLLLSVTSLTFFAAWWQKKRTAPLLFCGAFLGLAMMTKISAILLAVPYAAAFLARFVKGNRKRLFRQYALFGAVSIPLGIWFPLRNFVRFGQNPFYVGELSPTANASQYLAGISPVRRLLLLPLSQLQTPFQSWDANNPGCNIFLSLFKTSVFGEREWGGGIFAYLLLYVSIALALIAFVVLVRRSLTTLFTLRRHSLDDVWLLLTAVTLGSFILFCFSYPFICSQDFRYLATLLPLGALALGTLFYSSNSRFCRGLLIAAVTLFALSTTVVYALPHIL